MHTKSITDYIQSLHDIIPAIQLGLLPPTMAQVYHKFSESIEITTTAAILSSSANQDPFNNTGTTLYISSASDTDTQKVYLEGIHFTTGEITAEYVTLQGQTAVQLTNVYRTIFKGYNASGTAFSGDVYVGNESSPALGIPTTDNTYAHLPATYNSKTVNQVLSSIFTIPKNYTGFIVNWYGTATKGKDVTLIAYARSSGGIFTYKDIIFNFESSNEKKCPWLKFVEGVDFKVDAITSQGTVDGSVSYDLILIHNDYINQERLLSWR